MRPPDVTRSLLYDLYGAILASARAFAANDGFVEILPSLEGVPHYLSVEREVVVAAKSTDSWILPTSHTLTKQIAASYLPRVYCIGPCYRQETKTASHLDAFFQIEFEAADLDFRRLLQLVQRLVTHILSTAQAIIPSCTDLLSAAWRTVNLPAQAKLSSASNYESYVANELQNTSSQFVFLLYPPVSWQPTNRKYRRHWAEGFELLSPQGFGELASGGVRNRRYTSSCVDQWSPNLNVSFPKASAGFGLGLERFLSLILGTPNLRLVLPPHIRGHQLTTQSNEKGAEGIEWLIDASGCDAHSLTDRHCLAELLHSVVNQLGLTTVGRARWHKFPGSGGLTGMLLLSESHITCHTYPEMGRAAFNLYVCRPRQPFPWGIELRKRLNARSVKIKRIKRPGL